MNRSLCPLETVFQNPSSTFWPTPIWWWSGEPLEIDRLRWQMRRLAEGGARNLVILNLAPVGPLYGKDADQPALFTDEWWMIFEQVCQEAKTLGVHLYFYDQIGFSGANFQGRLASRNPAFQARTLLRESRRVAAGDIVSLPNDCTPLAAFYRADPAAVPQRLQFQGHGVAAPAAGHVQVIGGQAHGFDYFNLEAADALLESIHGQFERHAGRYLGDVIVGSFQDELPEMPLWSGDFAQRFQNRFGYDLLERLWALWEGDDAQAMQIRVDYHTLRAELAEAAFFKPFFEWHEKHKLICGFDQQGPARAGGLYGCVRLYADYVKTHRWYAAPGADLHGEAHIHRALADTCRRPRIWMEGFHSTGWGGTLEETFDWLVPWLRSGANLYNPHAVYYGTRGGWWEWAPPSTCFRQPYWRHYPSFARAVARSCHALTLGDHDCTTAVYYPTVAAQAGTFVDHSQPALEHTQRVINDLLGVAMWSWPQAGLLDQLGQDYNLLDDTMLGGAVVRGGELHAGRQRYRLLIVPAVTVMSAATLSYLLSFAEAGGTLIFFGRFPEHILGDSDGAVQRRLILADETKRIHLARDAAALVDLVRQRPGLIRSSGPVHHRRVDGWHIALVPAILLRATENRKGADWLDIAYTFDSDRYARQMTLTIGQHGVIPQVWCPVSGEHRTVEARPVAEGTQITLHFDGGPLLWLAWPDSVDNPPASTAVTSVPPLAAEHELMSLAECWQCRLVATVDNRYGDVQWPASETIPVQTWFLQHLVADSASPEQVDWADAKEVHATFGPFGWRKITDSQTPWELGGDAVKPEDDWQPVVYSLSRGIEREPRFLGPSGHVPQDFLDLGEVAKGKAVHFRAWIPSTQARQVQLMVGAAGAKEVVFNGERLEVKADYRFEAPVTLRAGLNQLDLRIVPLISGRVRALWCLASQRDIGRPWPRRAAWPGEARRGRICKFRYALELLDPVTGGTIQLGSSGPTIFSIDGREIGRHGGFMPYGNQYLSYHYRAPALAAGRHELQVDVMDCGEPPRFVLDGALALAGGGRTLIVSNPAWTVHAADAEPEPVALTSEGWYDPGFDELKRRPHPLPRTAWLEQPDEPSPMLDVVPEAYPGQRHCHWFRWKAPPGARLMTLAVVGEAKVWIAGEAAAIVDGTVKFPAGDGSPQWIEMRVEHTGGCHEGAVLREPVTYSVDAGQMPTGDWTQNGLDAWSGGVEYRQELTLDQVPDGPVWLDLGKVRGTVEVQLNGHPMGQRFCAPWRFDITGRLKPGANTLSVTVFNTLAPWLHATSPTTFVHPGQRVSGLLGPVRILRN